MMDYRHIVVTRNWYDSIVTGYLFHKAGKDCWLDRFGESGHRGWLLNNTRENWEQRLLNKTSITTAAAWWPPGQGRDLCRYLADESEEVGLRVYTEWAMSAFMEPVLNFFQRRQEREETNGWNRTMFLCYETLSSQPDVTDLYAWLFPGRPVAHKMIATDLQVASAAELDPVLRNRLNNIVFNIDTTHFNGVIAKGDAEFGCRERVEISAIG